MVKKTIIGLLMVILPMIASAQGAGGQVKRPYKKQQTMTGTPPKKKQASPKQQNEGTPPKQKPITQKTLSNAIIQRLINNMVYVEGGTFTMGATPEQGRDAYSDEKPIHHVTVSSFSIGKYEVTQEEWEAVMGNNPSHFKGAKRPVENVSWTECQKFINKLNSMTNKHFRLPTEAEWEYASRGGKRSKGYKYSGSDNLNSVAWFKSNSEDTTHDVGRKFPNELGLYDMSGNVLEWCQDWYDSYKYDAKNNPSGPSKGSYRVNRGGSWNFITGLCRVSNRHDNSPGSTYDFLGLRLAL
jgi:formylglycine-generating enzyme required for sulfatase activity